MGGKAMSREQLLQTAFAVARLGHRMDNGSYLGLHAFRFAGELLESFLAYSEKPEHKTGQTVCSSCEEGK